MKRPAIEAFLRDADEGRTDVSFRWLEQCAAYIEQLEEAILQQAEHEEDCHCKECLNADTVFMDVGLAHSEKTKCND